MQEYTRLNKRPSYILEIAFGVFVFLYVCPLIPFILTLIHPRFVLPYIVLLPFVLIPAIVLFLIAVTRLLIQLRKNPKTSAIKAAILGLTLVFTFALGYAVPWWNAAEGIYINLKTADFTDLRNWAQSVQFPQGKNYLHLRFGQTIPVAPAKFKPLTVWVEELDNKKGQGRITYLSWCGGLFGHVELLVGSPDMPIPKPNQYTHAQKTISPGVYINISE